MAQARAAAALGRAQIGQRLFQERQAGGDLRRRQLALAMDEGLQALDDAGRLNAGARSLVRCALGGGASCGVRSGHVALQPHGGIKNPARCSRPGAIAGRNFRICIVRIIGVAEVCQSPSAGACECGGSQRRFTRLINAFSEKTRNHACAVALHAMFYTSSVFIKLSVIAFPFSSYPGGQRWKVNTDAEPLSGRARPMLSSLPRGATRAAP